MPKYVDPYIASLNITQAQYAAKKEASIQAEQLKLAYLIARSQNISAAEAVQQILDLGERCGYGPNPKEACVARLQALKKRLSN